MRNALLSLVLILLGGLAVVQTLALDRPAAGSDAVARAAPRVLATAAAQAALGLATAMAVYALSPRAGLWVVLGVVLVALYPAAMLWPGFVQSPRAQPWVWVPLVVLVALAALDAVPDIIHEAAAVDRARGWFKFRTIVLPLIAPLLLLAVAFLIVNGFRTVEARAASAAYALVITAIVAGSGLARRRWQGHR